jgi:hypothetical protein
MLRGARKAAGKLKKKLTSSSSHHSQSSASSRDDMSVDRPVHHNVLYEEEEEVSTPPQGPLRIRVLVAIEQIVPRTEYERSALELLKRRNFAHVTVFNSLLLIKTGLGHDIDRAFKHAGWEHFHTITGSGSSLLTIEFLMSLNIETTPKETIIRFRFFNEDFILNSRQFSNALGFHQHCILDPSVLEKDHRYEQPHGGTPFLMILSAPKTA